MLKKRPLSALIAAIFALSMCTAAYADSDSDFEHHDGEIDEINEHASNETDMEHVANMVGGGNARVTRTWDGNYEIAFSDGSVVAVTPQGNTRVHTRSTGATTVLVDADGHLQVRTGDGYEMTVGSSQHNESETRNVLAQNGLSNITTSGNRVSGIRRDGSIVSMEADYQVNRGQSSANSQYLENSTGADIFYRDGTLQHYHGASVDINQVRASAQSVGFAVTLNSDGSANASSNGATIRVKFSPTLTQGNFTHFGLRMQNEKVIMQYQNGLEQEIIVVP